MEHTETMLVSVYNKCICSKHSNTLDKVERSDFILCRRSQTQNTMWSMVSFI
jgi:hypothetical protein